MADLSGGSPLTRRGFLIRLGVALGAASLPLVAACGQPVGPAPTAAPAAPAAAQPTAAPAAQQAPAAAKPGSLNVWFNANWNKVSDEALGNIFVEWGKKNNMEVEYQVISAQGDQKISAAVQAGQPPEIMEVWIGVAYWQKLGELVDMSDVFSQIKGKGGGLFPIAEKLSTLVDGKQWTIPFELYPWPVHARKDLWEQDGKGFPKTWDEFIEVGQKIQQPPKTYAFAMATGHESDHFGNFHDLMKAHGAAMQSEKGEPTFDHPGTVEALKLVKRMYVDAKIIPPDSLGATATNWNNETYQKGRGLAIINPPTVYGALMVTDKELLDKTGLYALPAGPAGSFTEVTFKRFVVYKKAKNVEKAKEALAYFMEPERYRTYTESVVGRSVPVFRDLTKTDFFQKEPFKELVKIVDSGGLSRWHKGPDTAWMGALENSNVVSDMIQKVVQGNEDPAAAHQWAVGEVQKIYEKFK